jgi:hypothetical protein
MVGGLAKRVQCLTCNKQHNYRAPRGEEKAPKKKAAPTGRAPSKARAPAYRQEWEAHVSRQADGSFVPYSTGSTFEAGQLIRHARFGRGYVKESLGAQKVNVLFEDGVKTLIHSRG